MKKIYCLMVSISFCFSMNAQPYFQKVFGSAQNENTGKCVVQSNSGSIYYLGNFNNTISGGAGVELIKLDAGGTIEWRQQVIPDSAMANRIIITTYNTLLINGQLTDSLGNTDAFALETDTMGAVIFYNSYGSANTTESFQALSETVDGGYVFSGFTTNPNGTGNAMYVVKTDNGGVLQWEQTYSDSVNSVSDDVIQTSDGGYILTGDKKTASANYNIHVIKTDSLGAITWETDIFNTYNSGCKNMIMNSEGNYLVIGESATATSTYFDPYITKLDTSGNIIWSHIVPCTNGPDAGYDIIEPSAGNYLITGFGFNLTANSTDLMVMRLDSLGNEVSRRYYGGIGYDQAFSLTQAYDKSGFLAAGFTIANTENKYFLIYDDNMGIPMSITNEAVSPVQLNFYPNPADDKLFFDYDFNGEATVVITDITGRVISKDSINPFTKQINTTSLSNGIYFIETVVSQNHFVAKIMVMHN